MKLVIGILVGAVLAIACVFAIEAVSHLIFPIPPGTDFDDPAVLAGYFEAVPLGGKLWIVAAWFVGALAGAWVANRDRQARARRLDRRLAGDRRRHRNDADDHASGLDVGRRDRPSADRRLACAALREGSGLKMIAARAASRRNEAQGLTSSRQPARSGSRQQRSAVSIAACAGAPPSAKAYSMISAPGRSSASS